MSYPDIWSFGLSALGGDTVPLSEELVPTQNNGEYVPPKDTAIVNMDINYNNGMTSPWRARIHFPAKNEHLSHDRRL